MARDPRLNVLIRLLQQSYDQAAWHGPTLRGALRGVTPAQAARRPRAGRHNIWELAVHCAYWKYAVRRRISGRPAGQFALTGSNWFARPGTSRTAAAWQADLKLLAREHRAMLAVVAEFEPARLDRRLGSRFTYAETIAGAAAHDLYHAEQIQLIKRLQR